jgi:hypothetical protein
MAKTSPDLTGEVKNSWMCRAHPHALRDGVLPSFL